MDIGCDYTSKKFKGTESKSTECCFSASYLVQADPQRLPHRLLDSFHFFTNTATALARQVRLDRFYEDVADLVLPKVVHRRGSFRKVVRTHGLVHGQAGLAQLGQDPTAGKGAGDGGRAVDVAGHKVGAQVEHGESDRVPELVAPQAVADNALDVKVDVTALVKRERKKKAASKLKLSIHS